MTQPVFNPTADDPTSVLEKGLAGMPANYGTTQDDEAVEGDQWAGYFGAIERLALRDTSSYMGFLSSTKLETEEEKAYADLMMTLASTEMSAPDLNRLDRLKVDRLRLAELMDYVGLGKLGDDPHPLWLDEYQLLTPLPEIDFDDLGDDDEPVSDYLKSELNRLVSGIEELQETVRRDRALGEFEDLGQFKRLYRTHGEDAYTEAANRDLDAPFFLRRLSEFCAVRSSGRREIHVESMLAKVVAIDQKQNGGGVVQSLRQRLGGRRRYDDDADRQGQDLDV